MAQPYVGEIRMFAGNFAPAGWMFCEGQLLPISENETLFQLIGTTYGGDGESTFGLPDLRGRLPIHQGNGFVLAGTGGAEEITLTVQQMAAHSHPMLASTGTASQTTPATNVVATPTVVDLYRAGATSVGDGASSDFVDRRKPAAHELPALPLRRFHHLAVRDLPVPDVERVVGTSPAERRSTRRRATMADPFVAEIRIFPFNFAPRGWAWCDGQLLPLSQNTALFSLLGTTYGGDGKSNFALPDLQGRAPMHPGQGPGLSLHDLGETGGSETVTLLESEMPSHPHAMMARQRPRQQPKRRRATSWRGPREVTSICRLRVRLSWRCRDQSLAPAGGDQPHNNLQPYLTFYFNIALQGVFPPRG